jgi:phage terminase small subunit
MALTPKQVRFVEEYLLDMNATAAARRAGYKGNNVDSVASRLVSKSHVQDEITRQQSLRSERTQITQDMVLQRLWDIATADPNELIEFRRTCCRFCYGDGYRYQRTRAEMDRDREAWIKREVKEGETKPDFDLQGGAGYDARKPPNPDCQECFGDGVGQAFAKDTRKLSAAARRLYAGVKITNNGLEVKMNDQQAATLQVGKHLGMFTDKHEHSGPNGGAIPISFVEFADTPARRDG